MSLWGNKDDKTSTGTIQVFANGKVTGTTTEFQVESAVGDNLVVNSSVGFIISEIRSNTDIQVVAQNPGTSVNAVSSGTNYTLNERPISVSFSESADSAGRSGDQTKVFGVDTTEAGLTDTVHAGWVRRTTGTGGRSGRTQFEVLVATGTIASDAADDTELPDSA
jgi:hypothetical protein